MCTFVSVHASETDVHPRALMRHEYRHCGVAQDMAGGAAEDELPQPALRVRSLDQEIASQCLGMRQHRLAGEAAIEADGQWFCRHAAPLQILA